MGHRAACNLLRRIAGRPTLPFRYRDQGSLATIGRSAAVASIGRFRFAGATAWLLWLCAHVYFLIGFRNRLVVLIDWAWAYWTSERHARVMLGQRSDVAGEPRAASAATQTARRAYSIDGGSLINVTTALSLRGVSVDELIRYIDLLNSPSHDEIRPANSFQRVRTDKRTLVCGARPRCWVLPRAFSVLTTGGVRANWWLGMRCSCPSGASAVSNLKSTISQLRLRSTTMQGHRASSTTLGAATGSAAVEPVRFRRSRRWPSRNRGVRAPSHR
jgi:hypothetical protein